MEQQRYVVNNDRLSVPISVPTNRLSSNGETLQSQPDCQKDVTNTAGFSGFMPYIKHSPFSLNYPYTGTTRHRQFCPANLPTQTNALTLTTLRRKHCSWTQCSSTQQKLQRHTVQQKLQRHTMHRHIVQYTR